MRQSARHTDPDRPVLSILMVNWRVPDLLIEAVRSATRSGGLPPESLEWLLLDNHSGDDSVERIRAALPDLPLRVSPVNSGFGAANNQLYAEARGRYVLLLNPDTLTCDQALLKMVRLMDEDPRIGILGARLLNGDGSFQRAGGGAFPSLCNLAWNYLFLNRLVPRRWSPAPLFMENDPMGTRDIDWVSGAALMLRPEAVGDSLFSPDFWMYGEDIELCHRVKSAGWRVVYTAEASVVHLGGRSMFKQNEAGLMGAPIKGPRRFFLQSRRQSSSFRYDGILLVGYSLRGLLLGLRGWITGKPATRELARLSWRYAGQALRHLTGRD